MSKYRGFITGTVVVVIAAILYTYFYLRPHMLNGDPAPDFTFQTMTGEQRSLSDFEGKYVLLDFWGSWCGPCRAESPNLVRLYKKYGQSDQFDIVSIGVETNEAAWARAIAADHLLWDNHYTEGNRFKSEIARKYGVRSIPAKFLINPRGQIVLVNPSFEQLEERLSAEL